MRKNDLKKFIKYTKKVQSIEEGLKALTDGRKNPSYTTAEVILPVLLGYIFREEKWIS